MPSELTLSVKGYGDLIRATNRADKATKREVKKALRKVGDAVRDSSKDKFAGVDARSAAGYRTVVRVRGIAVEQSLRKTTGAHPEFGRLQMTRALLPALEENEDKAADEMNKALDEIARIFARGA